VALPAGTGSVFAAKTSDTVRLANLPLGNWIEPLIRMTGNALAGSRVQQLMRKPLVSSRKQISHRLMNRG